MNEITDWTQVAIHSLLTLGQTIMGALPNILGALFLIVLGWIIAKIFSFLIGKGLTLAGFDKLAEKVKADVIFSKINITLTPSKIVGKFIYWVIILLFFVTASDTLGWTVVSTSIGDLLSYLPKLFSAIVIFVIGFYISTIVRKGLQGVLESLSIASAMIISSFAFYVIMIIITLTALDQAGIDTTILTSNVTIVIGGMLLAFAISFGLGSKEVLTNILSSFYTRKNFEPGQKITLDDVTGVIEKIDGTSCVIKTAKGKTVIPSKLLLMGKVDIE